MASGLAWRGWAVCFCVGFALRARGQVMLQACGAPPVVAANAQPNIFSEQQEEWLGEAMAASVEADFVPVRDTAQSAYVQRIAERLAATLPATHIHFRVQLIDSAEVNGLSIAGGRIYLTRKLAALAQSDDELASVIGHEMGHIASHQFAFETTRDMKRLLGVTSVGDRADVFAKYQQLAEARLKAKSSSGGDTDEKQDEADRIGVYVVAAAGYRPQANAEFWDRMFFTNGRKGGKLSDFFGTTKPTERRLGRITKMVASLPPGCGGQEPVRSAEYAAWHQRVVANRALETTHVSGAAELPLSPRLRMDLDRLRFSPDGRYVLAQDENTVMVFSTDEHKVLLKADAPGALPAQFSPDSKRLVFATQGLHTEMWDVAEQRMVEVHEPLAKNPCVQAKISPDGRTVICMAWNRDSQALDLSLLDAASGAVIWKKDRFFEPSFMYALLILTSHGNEWVGDLVPSSFSADGNFLVIGPDNAKLAFDLRTREPVKIGGDLRNNVDGQYAFVGSDRVAGINTHSNANSGIFSFPDGKLVKKMPMQFGKMMSVSASEGTAYVLSDGLKDFELGLADLDRQRMVIGSHADAMDVWNGTLVYENMDGTVVLRKVTAADATADQQLRLPVSDLGPLRALAISPDGARVAFSTRTRGGIWNLQTGRQELLVRGFTHVSWAADGRVYLDFPKWASSERRVVEVSTSTWKGKTMPYAMDKMQMEYGVLREWSDLSKGGKQITVRDLATGQPLWVRPFPDGMPEYTASAGAGDLLFSSPLGGASAKATLKANGTLAAEAAASKKKENARLIQAVNAKTGAPTGEVVVDLPGGYTGAGGLNLVGELLYVTSEDNRTLVYSMQDGRQLRQMYGVLSAADAATGRVCLHEREGELKVYDRMGVELRQVSMPKPLRHTAFADNGTKLWLLGSDQVIRKVPVGQTGAVASAQVSAP